MAPKEQEIIYNKPAPGIPYYTPAQNPPAGSALGTADDVPLPKLFTPLKIRGVEFQNRIFVSPMCQYSAEDGHHTDWHFAHLGGIVSRGPGLTIVEATAVTAEGRITPEDSGLWKDSQIAPLKRIVDFAHSQSQKIGIQLAHAGRKASTVAPWLHLGATAFEQANGWPDNVLGPSYEPFDDMFPAPKAMSEADIQHYIAAFVKSTTRALQAGFDVIEIHNAHGYLLHSFCSPVSNKRMDKYGGSFENRIRLTLEVVDAVRAVIPDTMPLFLRISATDWLEKVAPNTPSWRLEETIKLADILAARGVDFIDVSSGGNHMKQKVTRTTHAYQSPFAAAIKKQLGDKIVVGTVGSIDNGKLAESLLQDGTADAVLVGRQFQKRPGLVWDFADELGVKIKVANQIEWGFGHGHSRRDKPMVGHASDSQKTAKM